MTAEFDVDEKIRENTRNLDMQRRLYGNAAEWRAGEPLHILSTPSCLTKDPATWRTWHDRATNEVPSEWYCWLYDRMNDSVDFSWVQEGGLVDPDYTHWMPAEGTYAYDGVNETPAGPTEEEE